MEEDHFIQTHFPIPSHFTQQVSGAKWSFSSGSACVFTGVRLFNSLAIPLLLEDGNDRLAEWREAWPRSLNKIKSSGVGPEVMLPLPWERPGLIPALLLFSEAGQQQCRVLQRFWPAVLSNDLSDWLQGRVMSPWGTQPSSAGQESQRGVGQMTAQVKEGDSGLFWGQRTCPQV